MDISSIISIFFTLFIVVDPLGLIPVFVIYLSRTDKAEIRKIIFNTISVAGHSIYTERPATGACYSAVAGDKSRKLGKA